MVRSFLRQSLAAARMLAVFTVILGIAYPLAGVALAPLFAGEQIELNGQPAGSPLIGQAFEGDGWFQSRPSAGGYDAMASGGSNLGPNNPELVAQIQLRREQVAAREQVSASDVPADAVTESGSGLDPDISPAYAQLQAPRVAQQRGLPLEDVRAMIADATAHAPLGILGADAVNVVQLNAALAAAQ